MSVQKRSLPCGRLANRRIATFAALLALGVLASPSAIAASGPTSEVQTLFFDDFSAPLSTDNWDYNHFSPVNNPSFYGRTQQQQSLPMVSSGQLRLQLDTFNPSGFSFYGSEAITKQTLCSQNNDTGDVYEWPVNGLGVLAQGSVEIVGNDWYIE